MKVAFQGVRGAYSEVALRKALGQGPKPIPCETFDEVFHTVERGTADRGIVPIENSLAGSIHENYDLLLSHQLHIVAETELRIEHVLMCHPDTSLDRMRFVRSHPQALTQCSRFFARHRRLKPVAFFDTAGAAQSIAGDSLPDTGAIASVHAARLYGLKVLKRNLENQPGNFTRFFVISRTPWKPSGSVKHAKTSITFIPLVNAPGILFRILGVFALRDVNLLKIESRPDPKVAFDYRFYLDLEGGFRNPGVPRALEHLREMVKDYRLLGMYPMTPRKRLAGSS